MTTLYSFSIILLITILNFSGLFFAFKESKLEDEVSFDHWRFLPNFQLCVTALLVLLNLSSFLNVLCCKGIISPYRFKKMLDRAVSSNALNPTHGTGQYVQLQSGPASQTERPEPNRTIAAIA